MQSRIPMKVALIGTSAAGKSDCLRELGASARDAEMDCGLDVSTPQTAYSMLAWIVQSRAAVVATSVHREGLKDIATLKRASSDERLARIRFVYLFCEKEELEKRLRKPGSRRSRENVDETLAGYDEMDGILKEVMDECIDTTRLSMLAVATKVRKIVFACATGKGMDEFLAQVPGAEPPQWDQLPEGYKRKH
jgi:RNase adaptor protein for sRNA GlmZ degradation